MSQISTFYLGERWFGLPILAVREILQLCELTPVPLAPPQVRGLINLRGQIVTIFDLALILGLREPTETTGAHLVILSGGPAAGSAPERSGDKGEDAAAFLVEAVGDVVEAELAHLEPAPANVTGANNPCLQGVLKTDTGLLLLLNLDSILGVRA
jgi:purine-binding chemotaxis protein CheW